MANPIVTRVGLDDLAAAIAAGSGVQIDRILLGSGQQPHSKDSSKLYSLEESYRVESSVRESDSRVHVTALADSDKSYDIHEIGFLTSNNKLLAVLSSEGGRPLAIKSNHDLLIGYDLDFTSVPDQVAIEVTGPGERLNLTITNELAITTNTILDTQARQLDLLLRLVDLEIKNDSRK